MVGIFSAHKLPAAGPYPTMDPFLFCVYHKDQYPPAINDKMEAPMEGDGHHFDPLAPYRMYHGEKVPGFPQHPHRGFETITATIDGLIDHADSAGNAGRYGGGDVQWMTAGKGIVHSEMFPLLDQTKDNPTRFFQIWLNLPARSKMVPPSFAMFWADQVPKHIDDKVEVTVWAGHYFGVEAESQNSPPPDSWANDPANDVAILHITIRAGGSLTLPKARTDRVNRSLFLVEGTSDVSVGGELVAPKSVVTLDASQEVVLSCNEGDTEFLVLQGKPIEERVAQYGPFVMNTESEIEQAFMDYKRTAFGGWPWPRDDMVFEPTKGKFALENGKESFPDESCPNQEK